MSIVAFTAKLRYSAVMPKMTLQLSDEQAARLRAIAAREHRSMHGQMLTYIEQGLARDNPQAGEESSDD